MRRRGPCIRGSCVSGCRCWGGIEYNSPLWLGVGSILHEPPCGGQTRTERNENSAGSRSGWLPGAGPLAFSADGRSGFTEVSVSSLSAWSNAENEVVLKGWSLTPHRLVASTVF